MATASRASKSTAQRIGERIRQFRKSFGLTQAELAEKLEMDVKSISRLETATRTATIGQLERLAAVFNVPISHFLDDGEDQSSLRGREIASLLERLNAEQQRFVIDLVLLYIESHGKKPRNG